MKIQTKTIIIFLCLSLLPIIAIGTISYKNGKKAIEKNLGLSFLQRASETIDTTDRLMYEIYKDTETWAGLDLMQDVIISDIDTKISSFLMGLTKQYDRFTNIDVVNKSGEIVASSNFESVTKTYLKKNSFEKSITGTPYVSDIYFDDNSKKWIMDFAFPIFAKFNKEKIIGIICAKWKSEELSKITGSKKDKGDPYKSHIVLIREDGLIISAPELDKKDIFNRNLLKEGLVSVQLSLAAKEGFIVEKDKYNNPLLIGYHFSNGYRNFKSHGWAALVIQDTKTAFASVEQFKIIIFIFGAIAILCVTIISIIVSRKMTYPILKLSSIANMVAEGNFESKIEYSSKDEVGEMAKAFNKMTDNLKKITVSKDYVDNIIRSMIDSLLVVSREGIIKTVNEATVTLFGYSAKELEGKNLDILFFEKNKSFHGKSFEIFIKEDILSDYEISLKTKERKKIHTLFNGAVIRDKSGNINNIVCVIKDITERNKAAEELKTAYSKLKDIQEQLLHSAKLSAIGELAGGVAHELNNPLGGILGYAQYALQKINFKQDGETVHDNIDKFRKYLENIERESKRCKEIVQNLLKFARVSTVEYLPIDINPILNDTIRFTEHQLSLKNITITKLYDSKIPMITGNDNQLQQVFTNILINAQQSMPSGGEIKVISKYNKYKNGQPSWVEIQIVDSGDGISKKNITKIFNPFFTTKKVGEGTGLGLSVSYGIINDHGGEIICDSEKEKGTTFTVRLPVDH